MANTFARGSVASKRQSVAPKLELVLKRRLYVLFNKPYEVLTQFTPDQPGQRTLAEFGMPKDVYAAGRLDFDSEGLVLLTNDGDLIHRMLEPGRGHTRTYHIQVEGVITDEALAKLESGITIADYRTLPAKARRLDEADYPERVPPIRKRLSIPTAWIELRLLEGKNRQVRRMTAAVGLPTLRLIRHSIGSVSLGDLQPGEWRELTELEVGELRKLG